MQSRLGPNRRRTQGLLQPIADAVKLLIKEDITPRERISGCSGWRRSSGGGAGRSSFAVMPFGPPGACSAEQVSLFITDINVGLLYIVVGRVGRRLRHHPRGLGVEQQVLAAGRPARVGAADLLRGPQ